MNLNKEFLENSRFVLIDEKEEIKIKLALILSAYFPEEERLSTDKGFNYIWIHDQKLWCNQNGYPSWNHFKILDHNEVIEKG